MVHISVSIQQRANEFRRRSMTQESDWAMTMPSRPPIGRFRTAIAQWSCETD